MIGSVFALLSAMSYALNKIFIRRAVLRVSDADLGILISVPMAVPLFFLILLSTGQVQTLLRFSWQGYVLLSLAGILHFAVGRSFNYKCVQLVGSNISNILSRADIPVSVIIGIFFLNEPVSWYLAIGVLLILFGIIMTGLDTQMIKNSYNQFLRIPAKAFVFGFGCGISWGIAPIFVKLGLRGSDYSIAAGFISFFTATVVLSISLIKKRRRTAFTHVDGKAAILFFNAGLFSCGASLVRYIALGLAPASVVTPLAATEPVFGLIFAFFFNRRFEIFSRSVLIGTILIVIGTILIV